MLRGDRTDAEDQRPSDGAWPLAKLRPVALVSAGALTAYMAWFVHLQEMDFEVYRMGGHHVFGTGLYSSEITILGRHLLFTYPPLAALLFWPFSHLSSEAGQAVWNAIDLVALTALIAVSIAGARRHRVGRAEWEIALVVLAPAGLLLYPVRENLLLGQINLVLVLMIVMDLTVGLSWRNKELPRGVLIGVAAAIKLTPLVFLPYLILTRQWRTAKNAALTCIVTTGAMFAVAPRPSWVYFSKDAFDVERVGNVASNGNESLRQALMRVHLPLSATGVVLVGAALLCIGLAVATVAYRRSSPMLGLLVCAATGLMVSPISWTHHYVWVVPAIIWLLVGSDRPAGGPKWACLAALVFIVFQPGLQGGSGILWFLRNDAYVIATLTFIGLVAAMLVTRRGQQDSRSYDSDPLADQDHTEHGEEHRHHGGAVLAQPGLPTVQNLR